MTNKSVIQRGFVELDGEPDFPAIHFYRCGSGPPLFLLHPSPAAASVFLPLLPILGEHVTAIAIDTPGYGYSDGFDEPANDLQPYVERLHQFQAALGIESVSLFGSATGTQISIEYAKRYPASCHTLILDNIGDFAAEERDRLMDGYFPDLSIDPSGSHLTRIWTMALDVMRFFPWHDLSPAARLPAKPIPPDIVQAVALQFMLAGADYAKAYRPAFMNERAEALQAVPVDTTVLRSAGSILKPYADRLDAHQWPKSIVMRHCGAGMEERYQAIVDTAKEKTAGAKPWTGSAKAATGTKRMVSTPAGNAFLRIRRSAAPACLILHDIGSSADANQRLLESIADRSTVLLPDLPGHGATDIKSTDAESFLADCTTLLLALLEKTGTDEFSVLAIGESVAVALSLNDAAENRVKRIRLLNPTTGRTIFDPAPTIEGSHLTRLWQALRNDALYLPADQWSDENALDGTAPISAHELNRKTLDLLRSGPNYVAARRACDDFELAAAMQAARHKIRIIRSRDSTEGCRSVRSFAKFADFPAVDADEHRLAGHLVDPA